MPRRSSRAPSLTRQDRLRAVVADLRRRYGPHVIRLGAETVALPPGAGPARLSTGSLGLDLLVGGLPRGALTEYAGVEGAGAGTLATAALAACQQVDGLAVLVDAEGSADGDALDAAGADLAALVLVCPTTAAEAWEVLAALCRCGALDLLVLVSLPGLLELPGAGWGGYRLDRLLRRLTLALRGRGTALLLTNAPVPSIRHTVGGADIAQAAALRIALHPIGVRLTEYGDVAALTARAAVVRHRGLPLATTVLLEMTQRGLHRAAELVSLGRATGCLQETALGLAAGGRLVGRTDAHAAAALEADAALAGDLERSIAAAWRAARSPASERAAR